LIELSDKRRLLHELTDDVTQNVSKAQILYELSKSIASSKDKSIFLMNKKLIFYLAVSADGFNLYLVDETGTSMRLFTAENDE
jgi:hypothetical protein